MNTLEKYLKKIDESSYDCKDVHTINSEFQQVCKQLFEEGKRDIAAIADIAIIVITVIFNSPVASFIKSYLLSIVFSNYLFIIINIDITNSAMAPPPVHTNIVIVLFSILLNLFLYFCSLDFFCKFHIRFNARVSRINFFN